MDSLKADIPNVGNGPKAAAQLGPGDIALDQHGPFRVIRIACQLSAVPLPSVSVVSTSILHCR